MLSLPPAPPPGHEASPRGLQALADRGQRVLREPIAATTSKTGLRVHAERDRGFYPTNVQITDLDMAAIGLLPHDFHGEWNYTLDPTA